METADKGFRGSLAATPLPQILRRIFLDGLKGTLRLVRRDEVRNLFFEKGELRTPTSSREGQKIGAFRQRLGDGKRIPVLAGDPLSRYQYLPLTPQEAYLLSRVDGIQNLDALLKAGGASRAAAVKTLYALLSCGIVGWKSEGPASTATQASEPLNVEVSAQPAALSPGYAEMVRNTYRRIDWLTHYELFGIDPGVSLEQIRKAYFERSRAFHPDLRHRPDLADCQKELETVFARLRAAYETLSNARERAEYDASLSAPADLTIDAASNPQARLKMAARSYARARQLIEGKDFHPASRCCARRSVSCPTTPSIASALPRSSCRTPSGSRRAWRT